MRELVDAYPAWKAYSIRLLELLFLRKAEREYELLGLRADARYRVFLEKYPDLSARVKARHIASYLGITPVHLSRLRRRELEATRRSSQGRGTSHARNASPPPGGLNPAMKRRDPARR